jgi:hypothetical protein
MNIRELRILPPLTIARVGSAPEPVVNYTVHDNPDQPLDFRPLVAQETLVVAEQTGEIAGSFVPTEITFKDAEQRIRPVAPFLEVFVLTDDDEIVPLTRDLLRQAGVGPEAISWNVSVANRKVARRTNDNRDTVAAESGWFSNHESHLLQGHCPNFISKAACIDFGQVRYVRPNRAFPQIRLRFTPAQGLIYGPNHPPKVVPEVQPDLYLEPEKCYVIPPERSIYDTKKGRWCGFMVDSRIDNADPNYGNTKATFQNETLPPSLFAAVPPAPPWLHGNIAESRGYFDDVCDGIVQVRLKLTKGEPLVASARITSGPPAMVPDSLFLRNLADDLDQVLHGPSVPPDEPEEVTRARAIDIVRRAFETVRFLNVAVMNGNPVRGRDPLDFDTMPAEEAFDMQRLMRPIVPERTADTLAILGLHQQVFAALRGGAAPWFADVLRRPDAVADFTNHGRRKMPAMMCGADGSYLALTWRQINTIVKASRLPMRSASAGQTAHAITDPVHSPKLTPRNLSANLSAQLHYVAAGNPVASRPVTSIANCTPGLEVDFRAVWRRVLAGIELREYDNLVIRMDPAATDEKLRDLSGHRLLAIKGEGMKEPQKMMTQAIGPSPADPDNQSVVLATDANPFGILPLEWSNALAHIFKSNTGKKVRCYFTKEPVWLKQVPWTNEHDCRVLELLVRPFFMPGSAVISPELANPGELTQGLCSPWQNDYRECSCYYWASARPDYVNVEATASGASKGDNWMQKQRTGDYVADDYVDQRILHYDDLFYTWEKSLKFQIGGRDTDKAVPLAPAAPPVVAADSRKPEAAAKPEKAVAKKAPRVAPKKKR